MKKLITIILFLCAWIFIHATDYYVKTGGNDGANGLTDGTAWATITKVNTEWTAGTFNAGDNIFFNRANIFYGTITARESGSAGTPITISAYGTGAAPILTGLTTLSSWTNEGGGIYSAAVTSAAQTNIVLVDGIQVAMGRYPNAGTNLNYEHHATNVSIQDHETLEATTDWTGAEVVINAAEFTLNRSLITDHVVDVISYTQLSETNVVPIDDRYYFIQNDLRCLTATNEWYHNQATGRLYIYGDPSAKVVQIATLNYVFDFYAFSYITLDNLDIRGSISHAIRGLSNVHNYNIIQNCSVSYAGLYGIYIDPSDHNLINNCTISYCNQAGIFMSHATDVVITNNYIHNINMLEGQGWIGAYGQGIILYESTACLVQYNTIEYIGYNGISMGYISGGTISNNFINYPMQKLVDGGGIYIAYNTANVRTVEHNIILNSGVNNPYSAIHSNGIYLDILSDNCVVHHNTVANTRGYGYVIHNGNTNTHTNNTAFNNTFGCTFNNSNAGSSVVYSNIFTGNLMIAKDINQLCLVMQSLRNDITGFYSSCDNNYYARPALDNSTIFTNQPDAPTVYRTLGEWQNYATLDINSHVSPKAVTDTSTIDFYYNTTQSNRIITLTSLMKDITGTVYSGSVTLLPYTSVILLPIVRKYLIGDGKLKSKDDKLVTIDQ
jgi:parallel beta-helix repeat protein